jgi:class 3 adenylate cyclase
MISISAGIDSGSVTVGLTGGSGVVYDAWGPTVQQAADLAHRAGPDEVLVSAAVRTLLPSSFSTEDALESSDDGGVALVSGRTDEGDQAR